MNKCDLDLKNKKFGDWIVICKSSKEKYWTCRCKCGCIKDVYYTSLLNGKTKSCGCLKKEISKESGFKYKKNLEDTHLKYYKENTSIISLQQKLSKNSTTKVKGVSKYKNGKFRAYINLKRKQIHLGFFNTIEEAQEARKEAEKVFFQPLIEKYKGDEK